MTPLEFGAMGLTGIRRETMERLCQLPRGLVLLPGPCNCGKTTTMYSMISALNKPDRAIITVEDPVE
jgi:general secretion pathway protein E